MQQKGKILHKFDELLSKTFLQESINDFSIGVELYNLYTNLDPKAKTKDGALVSEVLRDILTEMDDIITRANQTSDLPETLPTLLKQLSFD